MASARHKPYFDWLSRKPCVRCKRYGVEIAHIEAIISPKTGLLMPRSHNTLARWGVIPLCPDCHRHAKDAMHEGSEEQFNEQLGRGAHYLWQAGWSLLVEYVETNGTRGPGRISGAR